jgi:hypothetical protein
MLENYAVSFPMYSHSSLCKKWHSSPLGNRSLAVSPILMDWVASVQLFPILGLINRYYMAYASIQAKPSVL